MRVYLAEFFTGYDILNGIDDDGYQNTAPEYVRKFITTFTRKSAERAINKAFPLARSLLLHDLGEA